MANDSQHMKSTISRNCAIARDLEILPLVLVEQVIKEATFEHLIRLSTWAGPQLTQALATSPSCKHLMGGEEDRRAWQVCLGLTDDINVLCYNTRGGVRPFFEESDRLTQCGCSLPVHYVGDKSVSFLQRGASFHQCTASTLRRRWLNILSARLRRDRSLEDLALFDGLDDYSEADEALLKKLFRYGRENLSAEELTSNIRLYQRGLAKRQSALANELRSLAILYEAYPSLLKLPFAPQRCRPCAAHVPQQFRSRAEKLERTLSTLREHVDCRAYFQDEHPTLVPYDWTLRFIVAVLGNDEIMDEKCRFVINGVDCYFLRNTDLESDWGHVRTWGTPWSLRTAGEKDKPEFLAGKCGPGFGRKKPYAAHSDAELIWLETFVEVVADLIERIPQAAERAQAEERRKGESILV